MELLQGPLQVTLKRLFNGPFKEAVGAMRCVAGPHLSDTCDDAPSIS